MSIAQFQVASAPDCGTISDALQSYFESLSADSANEFVSDLQIVSLDSNSIHQLQNAKHVISANAALKDVNFEKRMSQVLLNSQGTQGAQGEQDEFPETQHFVRKSSLNSLNSSVLTH